MPFQSYLQIVRSFFFADFGEISEATALEFFRAEVDPVQAAYLIGDGFGPDLSLRKNI